MLDQLGRSEEAIRVFDEVVARFGQASEPDIRLAAATALVRKGVRLGQLGRVDEAIRSYDEVVARFGQESEPGIREQVALALRNKGSGARAH